MALPGPATGNQRTRLIKTGQRESPYIGQMIWPWFRPSLKTTVGKSTQQAKARSRKLITRRFHLNQRGQELASLLVEHEINVILTWTIDQTSLRDLARPDVVDKDQNDLSTASNVPDKPSAQPSTSQTPSSANNISTPPTGNDLNIDEGMLLGVSKAKLS